LISEKLRQGPFRAPSKRRNLKCRWGAGEGNAKTSTSECDETKEQITAQGSEGQQEERGSVVGWPSTPGGDGMRRKVREAGRHRHICCEGRRMRDVG
jgi:hypothetical protein